MNSCFSSGHLVNLTITLLTSRRKKQRIKMCVLWYSWPAARPPILSLAQARPWSGTLCSRSFHITSPWTVRPFLWLQKGWSWAVLLCQPQLMIRESRIHLVSWILDKRVDEGGRRPQRERRHLLENFERPLSIDPGGTSLPVRRNTNTNTNGGGAIRY